MRDQLVVGFDLDMTLIDSRPGIKATYDAVSRRTGVPVDSDLVVSRLGPPVEHEMANWFEAGQVDAMADLYRSLYASHAVEPTVTMPGASASLGAVREGGGTAVVVTAKNAPHARLHLDHLGLVVDAVHGQVWREGKAAALRDEGAAIYVGDHVHDIEAARSAGAIAVGVSTGPCNGVALQQAGADAVLHCLLDFPDWLAELRSS